MTGPLTKEAQPGRGGQMRSQYILTDQSEGRAHLLTGRRRRGAGKEEQTPAPVNPEPYIGKTVTVVGKGVQRERDGKTVMILMEITSVTAASEAPAAK